MRTISIKLGILLVLALTLASCASSPDRLGMKEQGQTHWKQYAGDDAADLYLRMYDEVYEADRKRLYDSGYRPQSDFGARLQEVPTPRITLLVDDVGRLYSYWGRNALRLRPGDHDLEMQMRVPLRQFDGYDPNAPTEEVFDFPEIDEEVEAGHVYCLVVHRRAGKNTAYFQDLGTRESIERFPEIPDPLPATLSRKLGHRDRKLLAVFREVFLYVQNESKR